MLATAFEIEVEMKLLVNFAMLMVLVFMGLDIVIVYFSVWTGDHAPLWEFFQLVDQQKAVPMILVSLTFIIAVATWCCIALALWPMHKLVRAKQMSFGLIGRSMKRSGYASFGFWLGSTVMFTLFPWGLILLSGAAVFEDEIPIPIGFETIFLILSLVFLSVGHSIERAEAMEDELNHFL